MSDEAGPPMTPEEIQRFVKFHVQRYHLSGASILDVSEIREAFEKLRLGDPTVAEWGVAYLEAHPRHLRSGRLTNHLLRWLRHVELSESQRERLGTAILWMIESGRRPDFQGHAGVGASNRNRTVSRRAARTPELA